MIATKSYIDVYILLLKTYRWLSKMLPLSAYSCFIIVDFSYLPFDWDTARITLLDEMSKMPRRRRSWVTPHSQHINAPECGAGLMPAWEIFRDVDAATRVEDSLDLVSGGFYLGVHRLFLCISPKQSFRHYEEILMPTFIATPMYSA